MKHFNPNQSIQIADNFLSLSQQFFERYEQLQKNQADAQRPDLFKKTYDPYHPSSSGFKFLDDKVYNKKQYSYD
jgi:hypothetical protein